MALDSPPSTSRGKLRKLRSFRPRGRGAVATGPPRGSGAACGLKEESGKFAGFEVELSASLTFQDVAIRDPAHRAG